MERAGMRMRMRMRMMPRSLRLHSLVRPSSRWVLNISRSLARKDPRKQARANRKSTAQTFTFLSRPACSAPLPEQLPSCRELCLGPCPGPLRGLWPCLWRATAAPAQHRLLIMHAQTFFVFSQGNFKNTAGAF